MSTCNRLDLQTLVSQLIVPKNLPDHCPGHRWLCLCLDLVINVIKKIEVLDVIYLGYTPN